MSWNLKSVGRAADVKAYIAGITYIPQPLRDTVGLFADAAVKQNPDAGLEVETSGHFDANCGGGTVNKFSILSVALAPTAPPTPELAKEADPATAGGTSASPTAA